MRCDVAVVGGGPAGLALAAAAAAQGLRVALFERGAFPLDKTCGEGLMPPGVAALEALGARERLGPEDCAPFTGIRFLQEDGSSAVGTLSRPGLGVRRLALSRVLHEVAHERGVLIFPREAVRAHRLERDAAILETPERTVRAGVLVAADGLRSPIRRDAGLDGPPVPVRRYGMRCHFACEPWSREVEVHFSEGVEAYVTPCGAHRVGVAFLWEDGPMPRPARFDRFLARFEGLSQRLAGCPSDSAVRGAGPLWQQARAVTKDRLVLLGDAAGYVDALTGEGVSLALGAAARLAQVLPAALATGATRGAFAAFERTWRADFAAYARLAQGMLWLARRPALRRAAVCALGRAPWVFDGLLGRQARAA